MDLDNKDDTHVLSLKEYFLFATQFTFKFPNVSLTSLTKLFFLFWTPGLDQRGSVK